MKQSEMQRSEESVSNQGMMMVEGTLLLHTQLNSITPSTFLILLNSVLTKPTSKRHSDRSEMKQSGMQRSEESVSNQGMMMVEGTLLLKTQFGSLLPAPFNSLKGAYALSTLVIDLDISLLLSNVQCGCV